MAMGVVLTKRWGRPTSLLAFTSWQLIAGGLFLLPLALIVEGVPQTISLANVAGFLWLASVGTAVAYALWFRGVQILPIAQVTLLGLLSPVVAAIAGWLVLGQSLSPAQFGGMAIVLSALWIAVFFHGPRKAQDPPRLQEIAAAAGRIHVPVFRDTLRVYNTNIIRAWVCNRNALINARHDPAAV